MENDDPAWKFFAGTKPKQIFKPLSCNYCKQIGHINVVDSPCPQLLINMANDVCRICGNKGHRTGYCSFAKDACKFCDKTDHHELDKAKCKRQYCPPNWFFFPDNPKMSRKILNFNRFKPETFHLVQDIIDLYNVGRGVSSIGDENFSKNGPGVEKPSITINDPKDCHLDDFLERKKKSKQPRHISINEDKNTIKTYNKFSLLGESVDDDNEVIEVPDIDSEMPQPKKPRKSSKNSRKESKPEAESMDEVGLDELIRQIDSSFVPNAPTTQSSSSPNTDQSNNSKTTQSTVENVSTNVTTESTVNNGPTTNDTNSLFNSENLSNSQPDLTQLPNSQSIDLSEKPPDDWARENETCLPPPLFESATAESNDSSLINCTPPQPTVTNADICMDDDSDVTITNRFSTLSEDSKDLSYDTWNITYQNKLNTDQKVRLRVIQQAFETNQIGGNKKFDYYQKFMRRHNIDCLVTPQNHMFIYEQVRKIGDLPDFKSNPNKMKSVTAALNCISRLGYIDNSNQILPGFPDKSSIRTRVSSGNLELPNSSKMKSIKSRSFSGNDLAPRNSTIRKNSAANSSTVSLGVKTKLIKNSESLEVVKTKLKKGISSNSRNLSDVTIDLNSKNNSN